MQNSPLAPAFAQLSALTEQRQQAMGLQDRLGLLKKLNVGQEAITTFSHIVYPMVASTGFSRASLESYDPQATPSLEGLGSLLSKVVSLFKPVHAKPGVMLKDKSAPMREREAAVKELRAAMAKTYLSDSWLKDQEFVTEKVSGKGIIPGLSINGKMDLDWKSAITHQVTQANALLKPYAKAYEAYCKDIGQYDKELNTAKTGEELDVILRRVLPKIKAAKTPPEVCGYVGKKFYFLGGTEITFTRTHAERKQQPVPKDDQMIRPLTKEEIKGAAQMLLDIFDDKLVDFIGSDQGTEVFHDDDKPSRDLFDDSSLMGDYLHLVDGSYVDDNFFFALYYIAWGMEEKTAPALELWINRSIK